MSTTVVERDSSSPAAALLIFILFAVLIIGGAWFAYANGILGKPTVVEHTNVVLPTPAPSAPSPAK